MATWPPLNSLDAEGGEAIAIVRPGRRNSSTSSPATEPAPPVDTQAYAPVETSDLGRFVIVLVALLTSLGLVAIYAASSLKARSSSATSTCSCASKPSTPSSASASSAQSGGCPSATSSAPPSLAFVFALLLLIFVPGMYTKVGGAPRWLNLPIMAGQPAELTKLAMVLFLARNLSRPSADIRKFAEGILPNLIVLGMFSALLLCQKDLGTPVLLGTVTIAMLFTAGVSRTFIAGAAAGAISPRSVPPSRSSHIAWPAS